MTLHALLGIMYFSISELIIVYSSRSITFSMNGQCYFKEICYARELVSLCDHEALAKKRTNRKAQVFDFTCIVAGVNMTTIHIPLDALLLQ